MESNRPIKDFQGRILGYIWTNKETGNERATDFYGKILGFYDKKNDFTKDFVGKILARGNILSSLITDNYNSTKK